MRYLLFCCLFFVLYACQNDVGSGSSKRADLLVAIDSSSLREAPGEKSRELRALPLGERLTELGPVSAFITPIRFGDTLWQLPWIKVQTLDNQIGWVFAAGLKPIVGDAGPWYLQKQMQAFFGPELTRRRNKLAEQNLPGEEVAWAASCRESMFLRDTLMRMLAKRTEANEAGFQADFYWLRAVLPGFLYQRIAGGTQPYLFYDYGLAQRRVGDMAGKQVGAFLQSAVLAFPRDSIESFFPAWTLQITDEESVSQLGSGIHVKILQAIDRALEPGNLFEPELRRFTDALLADILDKNTAYWQPSEKILIEMNTLLAANFRCLHERDKLALRERLKMFEAPQANGIRVNLRSGE